MKKPIIILALLISSYVAYSQSSWERSDTILIQACFSDTGMLVSTLQDDFYGDNFWDKIIAEKDIVVPKDLTNLLEPYDFKPISAEYDPKTHAVIFVLRKIRVESEVRYGTNIKQSDTRFN